MWVWEKQSVSPALAGGVAANQTKDSNVQKMREFNEEGCVGVFTLFMLVQVSCSLIKMMMSRELPVLITFYLHFRLTSFWSRLKLNIYLRVQPCDGAMEDEKKFICQLLIINQAKTPCRICEEVLIYGEKLVPSQPGVSCSFSTDWVCLTDWLPDTIKVWSLWCFCGLHRTEKRQKLRIAEHFKASVISLSRFRVLFKDKTFPSDYQ